MSNNRPSRSNYRAIKLEKARNLHYVSRTKSLAVQTLNTSHDVPLNSILNTFCVSSVYHTCSPALAYACTHTHETFANTCRAQSRPSPSPSIHTWVYASIITVHSSRSSSLLLSLSLSFSLSHPSCVLAICVVSFLCRIWFNALHLFDGKPCTVAIHLLRILNLLLLL